jgi:hypothetical protein
MIAALLTVADFSFPAATISGWVAAALLVIGLLMRRGPLLPTGLGGLGLVALGEILHGNLVGTFTPLVGAALLASAEFGYWSFELEAGVRYTPRVILRRVGMIVGLVVLGASLSGTIATVGGSLGRLGS